VNIPQVCNRCGQFTTDNLYEKKTIGTTTHVGYFGQYLSHTYTEDVPVCRSCKVSITNAHTLFALIPAAGIGAAMWYLMGPSAGVIFGVAMWLCVLSPESSLVVIILAGVVYGWWRS